jgi:hypothetical protein
MAHGLRCRFGIMQRLTLILALLLFPALAHAEKVAVLPASGVNVHEGFLQAAQSLTRDHLEEAGFQVIALEGPAATQEIPGGYAVSQAKPYGVRFAVVIHITRLASSAKVKLTAYDVVANTVSYRGQLTAGSPDDLDSVIARLTKGMATGQAPEDTAEIDTVTEKESDAYLKKKATSVFGLRLGASAPLHSPDGSPNALPGFGVFWLYDVRTFLADVSLDFHTKDGDGDFNVSLGAYYPFSRENTTPYLGGGMRYGTSEYGGNGGSGISAYAAVGVLIGRLSTVQLRGELALFQNLFEENQDAGSAAYSNGFIVSAGIGF